MYGLARLLADLEDLEYSATGLTAQNGEQFGIISLFKVPGGRFDGRLIDLGIPAPPDFPNSVGSAIHVRADPQLYAVGDCVPNVRNITNSVLGPEWCYWSHSFGVGAHTTRRLLTQINRIFLHAS